MDWLGLVRWLDEQPNIFRRRLVGKGANMHLELFIPLADPDTRGVGHWNALRKDRLSGSRLMSLKNSISLFSLDRPQTISVQYRKRVLSVSSPEQVVGEEARYAHIQLIVCFLKATCLLSPGILTTIAKYLDTLETSVLQAWPRTTTAADNLPRLIATKDVDVAPFVEIALHAPWVRSGKQLFQLLSQGSVAATHLPIISVEQYLRSNGYFFVLPYPKLAWVAQRIGWEQLSVFLPATNDLDYMLPNGATVYAQLLILQQPIGGQHGGIVISARSIEALSRDNIVALLNAASKRLDWSSGVSGIVTSNKIRMTSPIQWSSLKTSLKDHHMFRPDASLNTWVTSHFLAPLVRTMPPYGMQVDAERRRVALQRQDVRGERPAAVAMADVVVMYIRASTLVQTEMSGTPGGLERQLVSMISDLKRLNPKKVLVAVEYCSTSQHPWRDRRLSKLIWPQIQGASCLLMTVNPDRLTRRQSDFDDIFRDLAQNNTTWFTQGNLASPATWMRVTSASTDLIHQVSHGQELAIQQGYYVRVMGAQVRVINSIRDQSITTVAQSLNKVAKDVPILGLLRTSPSRQKNQKPETQESLDRQQTFLMAMLPHNLKVTRWIRLSGVSAYTNDALDELERQLNRDPAQPPSIILVSSVDRLIRKSEQLNRLQEMLDRGKHQIVSYLWQPDGLSSLIHDVGDMNEESLQFLTSLCDSLHLLISQVNIGDHALAYPVVWPMSWFVADDVNPAVLEAASKAQAFCTGFKASSWQGHPQVAIPTELLEGSSRVGQARGFHQERERAWLAYVQEQLQMPVRILHLQGPAAWHCSLEHRYPTHQNCLCPCESCTLTRWKLCPCSADPLVKGAKRTQYANLPPSVCKCAVTCTCICEYCHHPGSASQRAKRQRSDLTESTQSQEVLQLPPVKSVPDQPLPEPPAPQPEVRPQRMCVTPGCPNPASVGGSGGIHCQSCYKILLRAQKVAAGDILCIRPGCQNPAKKKSKYCSVSCYEQDVVDPKQCAEEGCCKIILPGFGRFCDTHVRRAKKAKRRLL
ncbi:hypothetical protein DFS34DRAFT_436523 [Phlyctochytrium arcticum]|nr:hypothetical protein DFS34DRAFT_436523 [Phlyctochytrium arcticum]